MTPSNGSGHLPILAEELGMHDEDPTIVVHERRKYIDAQHRVSRAESEMLQTWGDSFKYVKHEKAEGNTELELTRR